MEWFNLGDSINQLGLLGAVAILVLTIFVAGGYIKKMKNSKAEGDLSSEDWDGIKEFKNDIPIGWGVTYLLLIFWGLWYCFVEYPLIFFSQIGEYNEELKAYMQSLRQNGKISMKLLWSKWDRIYFWFNAHNATELPLKV